jgi:hypothetical protein
MTLATLATIIAGIQDEVLTLSDIRLAPDVPPEQIAGGGVFAVVYPASGRFEQTTSDDRGQGEHTLHLMVATPQVNLRSDWARIIGFGTTVPNAILHGATLGGAILQSNQIRYTFGPLEWGGQQMFGWLFEIDVLTVGLIT